jgi:hypothetical protein
VELFSAKITALVNPSSSIADGAFTLTITLPRSSPALTAATLNPDGIALPLGTSVDGALGVEADGALGVVDGLGAAGMLGLGAVGIFGSVELLGVLGAENDGLEIVDTLGRTGTAL